ncbi:hypothetical protein J7J08_09770 [Stenotrophomonas sp. ISL-67]|uniref:hypothetical protein n=1 Tax=Stenotrophomonas sp. ISL-67 TaxID=2819171 RepID=UPI001BEA1D6E|nr:hypothetical protein [Stenotrophomonas sp. ISL-67]MBT2767926.1 hypothetical protein [Stenotrophomonas sp. ISL-67]
MQALLVHAAPGQLADHLANAVRATPIAARREALAQALREWDRAPLRDATDWRAECARVVTAVVDRMGQMQCRRVVGSALYLVANLAAGPAGAQGLTWTQQALALPRLLHEQALLPWLQWLFQLPLPSLRGGAWVEPLIALLPDDLEPLQQQADRAHAALHAQLQLPSSPVRLLLLGTAWVLWCRRQRQVPPQPPVTAIGQRLARLPDTMDQLDLAGTAVRRLFAAPHPAMRAETPLLPADTASSAAERTRLLRPALPIGMATAALMATTTTHPWQRRAAAATAGLAAATAGARLIAWALDDAYRTAVHQAGQQIDLALFSAPRTPAARAFGQALALHVAALSGPSPPPARGATPDAEALVAHAHVVLDLPVADHAPSFRQALRGLCGFDDAVGDALLDAAAGWALRRRPRSLPSSDGQGFLPPGDPATNAAAAQDHVALIGALWTLRDTASAGGSAQPWRHPFAPADASPLARALQTVRQRLMRLYRQDDFLQTLYAERTPPSTLRVVNGTLSGMRATSSTVIVLHPQPASPEGAAWSPSTALLLVNLQHAVLGAGTCFDNAVRARLDCALAYYLGQVAATTPATPAALDMQIHRLERALQQHADGHIASTNETGTLVRLQQQVKLAQAVPIRGLAPAWSEWRPDPRSHLGHNTALARGLLRQVAQQAEFLALCRRRGADPTQLVYPAHGAVLARALQGPDMIHLFDAGHPPAALAPFDTMLRGIATVLHAPVRSDGHLRVPEMLAYYAAPLPEVPMEEAQFESCLATLAQQIARQRGAVVETTRVEVEWDARDASPAQHDHPQVLDRLWDRIDARPETLDAALAGQLLPPVRASELHTAWQDAQEQLLRTFEQPDIWLRMRRTNASFHSLRVRADGITASSHADGPPAVVVDGLVTDLPATLSARLEALYRMTDRLGRFSPGTAVPLANALQFHGAYPPPSPSPCPAPVLCTQAQLLDAIARVQGRWQQHANALPRWRQASNELQDLGQLLAESPDAAAGVHRPAWDTTTSAVVQPALPAFARLLEAPELQAYLHSQRLVPRWVSVNAAGDIMVEDTAGRLHAFNATAALQDTGTALATLATLRAVAAQLGAPVRSDGRVSVDDTLAMHGGCGPWEQGHPDGASRCAERLLGELRLGMRADLVHAADVLGAVDLEQVRQATAAFLAQRAPDEQTLLEYLGNPLVERGDAAWDQLHRSSHFVASMARTPRAMALQTALLRSLDWYPGSRTTPTSPTLLSSLTRVAIVLDLGPPSDPDTRVLLGYPLHKSANQGRTFAQIRLDFHDHLHRLGRLPSGLLGMATTLALQDHAPELLAADVPPTLVYGTTVASINFVTGVHLAERMQRGLSQQMRFSELLTLAADLANDSQAPALVKQLTLQARRLPTLDWYLFRQPQDHAGDGMSPAQRIDAALHTFDQRVVDIERAISDVLAPLPYRMPLVEAEIRRVFPRFPGVLASQPWNSTEFRLCRISEYFEPSVPFYELVAAGALRGTPSQWQPCRTLVPDAQLKRHEAAMHSAYVRMKPLLPRLADINARYQKRFDTYFRKAQRGYGVLIEEALHQRPLEERRALQRGDVQVFTLRTHEPDLEAQQETRNDTDPYRGRFGVVYTLMLDGQPRHFQLFPLQCRIIPLLVDGPLPLGGELQRRSVRLRSGNVATIRVRRGTPLPVDLDAYVSDKMPQEGRSSDVIVEPLRVLPPANGNDTFAPSPFHALVDPVQRGFFWLDAATFHREGWAQTSFEERRDGPPLWLEVVDFFVPFVENLRRISSKNRNEFAMAAFGLYLETIIVVGPVIGGVVKVLARPGLKLTMPRVAELTRVIGRGAIDALNPAAGSLALLRMGVTVVQRTASGNLRFLWALLGRSRRANGLRWLMREGMAAAEESSGLSSPIQDITLRTVDGIPNVLVARPASGDRRRTLSLFDPATLSAYGPPLQERIGDGSGAAGMLLKVGGAPRAPHVSPGKALKPIKQGPKGSEEQPDDTRSPLQPPSLTLPDHHDSIYPDLRP